MGLAKNLCAAGLLGLASLGNLNAQTTYSMADKRNDLFKGFNDVKVENNDSWRISIPQTKENNKGLDALADMAKYSLGLSLFDYFGYNLSKDSESSLKKYRIVQAAVKTGILFDIYRKHGIGATLGFGIFDWTFGHDFMYYGWNDIMPGSLQYEWDGRFMQVIREGVTHAGWTPAGLWRKQEYHDRVPGDTLLAQGLVGLGFYIALPLIFE